MVPMEGADWAVRTWVCSHWLCGPPLCHWPLCGRHGCSGVSQEVVFATSYPTHSIPSHPTPPCHPSHLPPLLSILTAERDGKKYHEIQPSEIEEVSYNKNQSLTKYFTAEHTGTIQS